LCVLAGEAAKLGVVGHIGIVTVLVVGVQGDVWVLRNGDMTECSAPCGVQMGGPPGVSGRSYCSWRFRWKPMSNYESKAPAVVRLTALGVVGIFNSIGTSTRIYS
jgi:hypothetical protein